VGQAIGDVLPLAVGVAISPLPIVAVVLMLATPHGRANGPAFVLGWIAGVAIVGTVVLLLAGGIGASDGGGPKTWVSVLELVLGVLLLLAAVGQWRQRPHGAAEPPSPKWMKAIDTFTPAKSAGLAAVMAGPNPKNLMLTVAAAAAIAQAGLPAGDQAVTMAVFVVIATLGTGAPVAIYFLMGERSKKILADLRHWMVHNNTAIMAVLLLVIGAKIIGSAVAGLTA
jgi:threonine/homoserine/homoserine lactone efflux protein